MWCILLEKFSTEVKVYLPTLDWMMTDLSQVYLRPMNFDNCHSLLLLPLSDSGLHLSDPLAFPSVTLMNL
jgi:hypothetical protein